MRHKIKNQVKVAVTRYDDLPTLNLLLRRETFSRNAADGAATATLDGVITRSLVLCLLSLVTAVGYWELFSRNLEGNQIRNGAGWPLMASPFVLWFLHRFLYDHWGAARMLAPLAAVTLGCFYGAITGIAELYGYGGVAAAAMTATFFAFAGMLIAYRQKWIRAGARERRITLGLIHGVAAIISGDSLLSIVDVHYRAQLFLFSLLSIAITIAILLLSFFVLLMDLSVIEDNLGASAPREMEWFFGYSILFDLVWMYIATLLLLGRLASVVA